MNDSRSLRASLRYAAVLAAAFALAAVMAVGRAAGDTGGASTNPTTPANPSDSPFSGAGMWIWELPQSSGGKAGAIVAKARRYKIRTVFIKSSDGTHMWRQFTSSLVRSLRAGGLHVCAWQYVYGRSPATEASLGARARKLGAECLVIDAEMEYEGRYASAQSYMGALRRQVGSSYPLALAGFPYVDYHPAFPYSVFFGPNGAQYNVPQMYWKAIGTTVDRVYSHSYRFNRPYARAIAPLGQLYMSPRQSEIVRFRQLARAYHARGLSWWDWQEASGSSWHAVGTAIRGLTGYRIDTSYGTLTRGAQSDLVVWAQQHLRSAGLNVRVDGVFGSQTVHVVRVFQARNGLRVNGAVDTPTWRALLRYPAAKVRWTSNRKSGRASTASSAAGAPRSASRPALRREIPPKRH